MSDQKKTKAQLISELADLRQRIGEAVKPDAARPTHDSAIQEHLHKYGELYRNLRDGVAAVDHGGFIVEFNDAFLRMLGYTADEIRTLTYEDLTPAKWHAAEKKILEEQVLKRGWSDLYEKEYRRKDGTVFPVELQTYLMRDAQGNHTGFWAIVRDVSAYKKAKDDIRVGQEKYGNILDSIEDGYFEVDLTGNLTFFNDAMCRIADIHRDELMGMNNRDYTSLKTAEEMFIVFNKIYETGEPGTLKDYEIIRKDGSLRHLELSASLIRDQQGNPIGFRGIARDITERKRAEEALRESEERHRLFFENITDVVFTLDTDMRITGMSPSVKTILGYDPENFIGRSVMDTRPLFTPESFKKALTQGAKILAGEKLHRSVFELVATDGTVKKLEFRGSALTHNGAIVGMLIVARDNTERMQAEEALVASEARFRALIEESSDIIMVFTTDGLLTYASPSVKTIMGYSPEQLIGKSVFELIHPEDLPRVMNDVKMVLENPEKTPGKTWSRVRHADGTWHYHEGTGTNLLNDPAIRGFVLNSRDITKRRESEDALERSFVNLRKSLGATIRAMALAVETRDPYTAGHQQRVSDLARTIAQEMGLPADQIDGIRMAGTIHDLGKIAIPGEILSKPMKLTKTEFELIKKHPEVGFEILKDIDFPWPIARIVVEHHERLNGSGYPHGLAGDDILLESRIIAVADVVEAISSHRPYRPAYCIEKAFDEIREYRNVLYDSGVVDACLKIFENGYKMPEAI